MPDFMIAIVSLRRTRTLGAIAVLIAAVIANATPAAAQAISGASAGTAGSTGNGGDGDGSIRSSTNVQINDGTTLKTRYAWNISADTGVASTRDSNATAKHNLSFDVTAPGGYRLDITQQRVGIMQRNSDVSGCSGSADISTVNGTFTGGSLDSGSLNLSDPGAVGAGGGDSNTPFNQTANGSIGATSNGGAVAHTLAFTWTGTTRSNSCEAAVRMGEGSSVSGCDACVYPGTPSRTQNSDGHFVTVTLVNLCGNGAVDAGEECDTALPGSCCASTCQFKTSSNVCRPSAGVCDTAENCTGASATCPGNGFQFGTPCRAAAGVCDTTEFCNGSSASCPANTFEPATTLCRPASDVCDVEEFCTGSSAACPANAFLSAAELCRGSADVCDLEEHCTGTGPSCPGDAKSTAVCRPPAGGCDIAESCDGVNDNCPSDDLQPAGATCRAAAGVCDVAETCDGASADCPADAKSTAVCRSAAGVCDVTETCDGIGDACPADALQSSGTECRASAGGCDVAETCTGASVSCPADALRASGFECRPSAGGCDVAETCDGAATSCPADVVQAAATECRASAGPCDIAEACDGSDPSCPADAFEASSTVCRAAVGGCDLAEQCSGSDAACPADALASAGATCRPAAGVCDVAETCDGSDPSCPADAFEPSSVVCRPDAGQCDVAESCSGADADCPTDGFEPNGTTCDDTNTCTNSDQCVAGVCVGNSMLCGNGTIESGCGEVCDDGNTSNSDGCSASCQLEPGLSCAAGPATGCKRPIQSAKASLLAKNSTTDNAKDLLKWKWLKGERTTTAEYGTPLTSTNYQLCVYDQSGLRLSTTVPAGGTCGTKPCWKATGISGFKYKNKALTPDGVLLLTLKSGADGKAKIGLVGKGGNLGMPDLSTITQPVTVQIQNSDALCWEAIYSSPPITQSPVQFKDKAD